MNRILDSRSAGVALTAAIVTLTAATAYIHFTLGGLLFLLNGLGYAGLIMLVLVGATVRHPLVRRFAWFPRTALIGYTALTIAGYLAIGPYFSLGFITKGIEVALIFVVLIDVIRVWGSPQAMVRAAVASVLGGRAVLPAADSAGLPERRPA